MRIPASSDTRGPIPRWRFMDASFLCGGRAARWFSVSSGRQTASTLKSIPALYARAQTVGRCGMYDGAQTSARGEPDNAPCVRQLSAKNQEKGNVLGNDSLDRGGAGAAGCDPRLAPQQKLGLRARRNTRIGLRGGARPAGSRPHLNAAMRVAGSCALVLLMLAAHCGISDAVAAAAPPLSTTPMSPTSST